MNLVGLRVMLDCPPCCNNVCTIGAGKGPHVGRLDCADCGVFRGWLPKEAACFIESVVATFGVPNMPIVVHKAQDRGANNVVPAQEQQRRIYEIKRRIELSGFELRDFLLTARPLRDWYREQQRRAIAQLMYRYGLTAHDLNELPSDVGAVGGMKANRA